MLSFYKQRPVWESAATDSDHGVELGLDIGNANVEAGEEDGAGDAPGSGDEPNSGATDGDGDAVAVDVAVGVGLGVGVGNGGMIFSQ
jgi:hypothetical protein